MMNIQRRLNNFTIISFVGTFLIILLIFNSNEPKKIDNKCLEEIFDKFFNQSSEQQLISKEIIFRTLKYMMEERDEYDPELVFFVRTMIVSPHKSKTLNLSKMEKFDFSQAGQSFYIDEALGRKRNGFFIESGGYDGEVFSNSLFFELKRNWTGILIEPIPSLYNKILSKNRQIYALNACLAGKKPIVAKFRVSDVLSSRISQMSKLHESRINKEFGSLPIYVNVPCFSINTIMKALEVNTVDYFSLDVEGSELSVIESLDLKNIDIKSFSIEYNGNSEVKKKIQTRLEENGFKLTDDDGYQEIYFLKNF